MLENGLDGELDDELGYTKYDYRNKEGENSRYYINQAGGYASNAKKRSAFVVYMNGTVSRIRSGSKTAIEPGCEIIIPTKDPSKRMSVAEMVGMGTSIATLGTMIATLVNLFK